MQVVGSGKGDILLRFSQVWEIGDDQSLAAEFLGSSGLGSLSKP